MQTEKNIENHSRHPLPAGTIIVIGRQFGSGGRRIGRLVAEKTGFRYYDKELLAKAAESLGFSQKLFDKHDERKPSTLHTLLQGIYGIADNFHDTSICGESLYQAQSRMRDRGANRRLYHAAPSGVGERISTCPYRVACRRHSEKRRRRRQGIGYGAGKA